MEQIPEAGQERTKWKNERVREGEDRKTRLPCNDCNAHSVVENILPQPRHPQCTRGPRVMEPWSPSLELSTRLLDTRPLCPHEHFYIVESGAMVKDNPLWNIMGMGVHCGGGVGIGCQEDGGWNEEISGAGGRRTRESEKMWGKDKTQHVGDKLGSGHWW